jgi:hypothetical protein
MQPLPTKPLCTTCFNTSFPSLCTGGLGNLGQMFDVVPLAPWSAQARGNNSVPQISMCRGPGRRDHIWGLDLATGKRVFARAGSLLQYSYDGTVGKFKDCDNPTYPGEHPPVP